MEVLIHFKMLGSLVANTSYPQLVVSLLFGILLLFFLKTFMLILDSFERSIICVCQKIMVPKGLRVLRDKGMSMVRL